MAVVVVVVAVDIVFANVCDVLSLLSAPLLDISFSLLSLSALLLIFLVPSLPPSSSLLSLLFFDVARACIVSAQGRRFRCLALAACCPTLHPVIIVFARVPFVGCGEWRPQRNPSMSWAMSRDMAAAGARG